MDFCRFDVFGSCRPARAASWARAVMRCRFWGCSRCTSLGTTSWRGYNRVRTSLPYYLPFPLGLGTFGAVIRIKDRIFSRREFFDIGLAGPLAGLLVAVPLLVYGFTHLPPLEYLFAFTPICRYGADYAARLPAAPGHAGPAAALPAAGALFLPTPPACPTPTSCCTTRCCWPAS